MGPSRRMLPLDAPTASKRSWSGAGRALSSATVNPMWSSRPRLTWRGEAVGRGVVPDDLEDVQHHVSGDDAHGGCGGAGTEHDGRFEADAVFVEGAAAVEIGRHHGDVAHAHRFAPLRIFRSGPHTL